MTHQPIQLFSGDAYRCDRALREREAALLELDPGSERHLLFADEVDPSSLAMELQSASLFSLGRHFVIRQVNRVKKTKAFAALLNIALPEGTYLTLLGTDLKATNPAVKAAKASNAFVALPAPRGGAVHAAAKALLNERGIRLPEPALRLLVLRSGNSLLAIEQEADKLRALGDGAVVDENVARRLVFSNAEQTVYPLYDKVGEGDLRGALCELETLRDNPGRVLGGAIRHLSRLVMVRLLLDRRERSNMASWVGQPDWLLKRLIAQAKRRPLTELAQLLRTAVRLDREIKRGLVPAADALLTLVLSSTPRAAQRAPG